MGKQSFLNDIINMKVGKYTEYILENFERDYLTKADKILSTATVCTNSVTSATEITVSFCSVPVSRRSHNQTQRLSTKYSSENNNYPKRLLLNSVRVNTTCVSYSLHVKEFRTACI